MNRCLFGMKFITECKLAFIYLSVVNEVVNLIVVIVTHLIKPLLRIHKTELKVKLFFFIRARLPWNVFHFLPIKLKGYPRLSVLKGMELRLWGQSDLSCQHNYNS